MNYLVTGAASLVGGKRWLSPYGTDWQVPCILWCAALGDPSSRKSSPLGMLTKPLWSIKESARADYDEARRGWAAECERAKAEKAKWQEELKKAAGTTAATPPPPLLSGRDGAQEETSAAERPARRARNCRKGAFMTEN